MIFIHFTSNVGVIFQQSLTLSLRLPSPMPIWCPLGPFLELFQTMVGQVPRSRLRLISYYLSVTHEHCSFFRRIGNLLLANRTRHMNRIIHLLPNPHHYSIRISAPSLPLYACFS